MERWAEGKLIADDEDVAYEPTDKEGKRIAAKVTMYLRLLMWRVKMDRTTPTRIIKCSVTVRPDSPQK